MRGVKTGKALRSGEGTSRKDLRQGAVTRQIIGAFYEVYNELGYGFAESVYRESVAVVLESRGLRFGREVPLVARFRGRAVGIFKADFLVDGGVIVEIKAKNSIERVDRAQLLNYLRVAGVGVGLLLNFGPHAEFERLVGRDA